ncbi:MAG: ribosome recycling factor [Patescibacteria group bacterium]
MAYNLSQLKTGLDGAVEWLRKEYVGLRTGRANPAVLDIIQIEAYGGRMPINQLAGVNIEDAFTIRITPWDANVTRSIESGIQQSDLGLSVATDDKGLRVIFPRLTNDTRQALIKVAKQKLEEARIKIRNERQKTLADIEKKVPAEDEQKRLRNEIQKLIDEVNSKLEELSKHKEKEISE